MDNVGPRDIRIPELIGRVKKGSVREVVLATSTSIEGESTASYIAEQLQSCSVQISRIASGIPMGGDLKYIDQVTLKRAMEKRHGITSRR
jgi:recombination protein RecR